jgi:hypothetical protein
MDPATSQRHLASSIFMARIDDKGSSSPTALAQLHAFAEYAFGGLPALRRASAVTTGHQTVVRTTSLKVSSSSPSSSSTSTTIGTLALEPNLGKSLIIDTLIAVGILRALGIDETTLLTESPKAATRMVDLASLRVRNPWKPDEPEISGSAFVVELQQHVKHGYGGVLGNVVQRLHKANALDAELCKALVNHNFGGGYAEKIISRRGSVDVRPLHYSAALLSTWAARHGKTLSDVTKAWIATLDGDKLWSDVFDLGQQLPCNHPARTASDRKQRKR